MAMKLYETDENVLILPGAKVMGDVTFGPECSVWYNAVIRGDNGKTVFGRRCAIEDSCVFHGAVTFGDNVTVGHGAIVHGCTVGSDTLIGMGAIILTGAVIGSHCMIAAGALVTGKMRIPDGSMVMGSPAKVVRPLTEEELEEVAYAAEHYANIKELHR